MLKTIFAVSLCFLFCKTAQADTIDFWHVFYNRTLFKKYDSFVKQPEIVFRRTNIKNTDSLTVKYFRDTPCSSCSTRLTVEDSRQQTVVQSHGKGTFNPLSFAIADLLKGEKTEKQPRYFEVYYYEETGQFKLYGKKLLFRIKIE